VERLRQDHPDYKANPTAGRPRGPGRNASSMPTMLSTSTQPGKDSYEHRKAGACEVIVSSARRWVQMHEVGDGPEATLAQLLARPIALRPGVG